MIEEFKCKFFFETKNEKFLNIYNIKLIHQEYLNNEKEKYRFLVEMRSGNVIEIFKGTELEFRSSSYFKNYLIHIPIIKSEYKEGLDNSKIKITNNSSSKKVSDINDIEIMYLKPLDNSKGKFRIIIEKINGEIIEEFEGNQFECHYHPLYQEISNEKCDHPDDISKSGKIGNESSKEDVRKRYLII